MINDHILHRLHICNIVTFLALLAFGAFVANWQEALCARQLESGVFVSLLKLTFCPELIVFILTGMIKKIVVCDWLPLFEEIVKTGLELKRTLLLVFLNIFVRRLILIIWQDNFGKAGCLLLVLGLTMIFDYKNKIINDSMMPTSKLHNQRL